ncbi:hypothetical protein KP509_02G073900 [Ceratopteris richardii]|uniref:Uncharacterized protein n=1 Tax=Ceratopteris richardii TaxID=49495 RepID=A0A8T2VB60_CERRI|nr:hypothetical protein KP509_02G073900 [Ceratopteris richardii]
MMGNGHCEALCIEDTKHLCHIQSKIHEKVCTVSVDLSSLGFATTKAIMLMLSSSITRMKHVYSRHMESFQITSILTRVLLLLVTCTRKMNTEADMIIPNLRMKTFRRSNFGIGHDVVSASRGTCEGLFS